MPPKLRSVIESFDLSWKEWVLMVGLLGVFGYALFTQTDLWKAYQVRQAEAERQQAIKEVYTLASTTGMFWASAWKACNKIGLPDIHQCAGKSEKEQLLQETAAVTLAQTAVSNLKTYAEACYKVYSQEECNDLVNRAYQLSLRQE
jgi:hypothetical protein